MNKKEIKTTKADKYLKSDIGIYEFPFTVLDKTEGGSNLGRININIELVRAKRKKQGRYYIESVLLWFRQTRDTQYMGKIFKIPMYTEQIYAEIGSTDSFMSNVWSTYYCDVHKQAILSAYPKNHHTKLVIESTSSIMNNIYFK